MTKYHHDAIEIWTDQPTPIREALSIMTDDWIEQERCEQTTIDLRDACRKLLSIADLWQWMTNVNCTVRRDADISRSDCWWFMDVDGECIARGTTPIDAIEKAMTSSWPAIQQITLDSELFRG